MRVVEVPSGLVIMTSYSGWFRDAWTDGVNHRLTKNVWPRPTVVGLKLRCATGVMVAVGVAPDGRGPAIGTSGAANTVGIVNIVVAEAINRIIAAIAVAFPFLNFRILFLLRFFAKLGKSFVEGPYLLCSVLKLCQKQDFHDTKNVQGGPALNLNFHETSCRKKGGLNPRLVSFVMILCLGEQT